MKKRTLLISLIATMAHAGDGGNSQYNAWGMAVNQIQAMTICSNALYRQNEGHYRIKDFASFSNKQFDLVSKANEISAEDLKKFQKQMPYIRDRHDLDVSLLSSVTSEAHLKYNKRVRELSVKDANENLAYDYNKYQSMVFAENQCLVVLADYIEWTEGK